MTSYYNHFVDNTDRHFKKIAMKLKIHILIKYSKSISYMIYSLNIFNYF